jgi:hypothetical protein
LPSPDPPIHRPPVHRSVDPSSATINATITPHRSETEMSITVQPALHVHRHARVVVPHPHAHARPRLTIGGHSIGGHSIGGHLIAWPAPARLPSLAHLPAPVAPPAHAPIRITPPDGDRPFGAPSTGVTLVPPAAPQPTAGARPRRSHRKVAPRAPGAGVVLAATVVTLGLLVGALALGGLLVG